jgi:hypothetical protein
MRFIMFMALVAALSAPVAATAEVKVNINVGVPVVPLPPPPPVPVPVGPKVFFQAPPLFLAPSSLGFYVGVDMPYDLVLVSGTYYLFHGNNWYRSSHYNGPWVTTRYESLPGPVRQYKVEHIRYYRDHEYRNYREHREHYRGHHYRPDKHDKQDRKEEKRWEKEERKWEKEEQKRYKKHNKHED